MFVHLVIPISHILYIIYTYPLLKLDIRAKIDQHTIGFQFSFYSHKIQLLDQVHFLVKCFLKVLLKIIKLMLILCQVRLSKG